MDTPKTFVLRPYLGDGATQKSIREACGLGQLHQAGYPVPAILLSETDSSVLGRPFTIMEKLEGRPLWPVLTYAKLLASTVISLRDSPEKLGMRSETVDSVERQVLILEELSRRIQDITGLTVPEVEIVLSRIS